MMAKISLFITALLVVACSTNSPNQETVVVENAVPIQLLKSKSREFIGLEKLSEYGFFQRPLADLNPLEGVIPYDLNSPL